MKRDKYQRQVYAIHRMSAACERIMLRRGDLEKAAKWAKAWARYAGYRPA